MPPCRAQHLDLGHFSFTLGGVVWPGFLGGDNYYLDEYFAHFRFAYYRTSSVGQNCLRFDGEAQDRWGRAVFRGSNTTGSIPWAVLVSTVPNIHSL
jgi:hypothetical protein